MPRKLAKASMPVLRSHCPVCAGLEFVGDRWTLLIVRDMLFFGKRRYGEFADAPESIPTNILAERLKKLQRYGLVTVAAYQDNPPRYEYQLTAAGLALRPILEAIAQWSLAHVPVAGHVTPEELECLHRKR